MTNCNVLEEICMPQFFSPIIRYSFYPQTLILSSLAAVSVCSPSFVVISMLTCVSAVVKRGLVVHTAHTHTRGAKNPTANNTQTHAAAVHDKCVSAERGGCPVSLLRGQETMQKSLSPFFDTLRAWLRRLNLSTIFGRLRASVKRGDLPLVLGHTKQRDPLHTEFPEERNTTRFQKSEMSKKHLFPYLLVLLHRYIYDVGQKFAYAIFSPLCLYALFLVERSLSVSLSSNGIEIDARRSQRGENLAWISRRRELNS